MLEARTVVPASGRPRMVVAAAANQRRGMQAYPVPNCPVQAARQQVADLQCLMFMACARVQCATPLAPSLCGPWAPPKLHPRRPGSALSPARAPAPAAGQQTQMAAPAAMAAGMEPPLPSPAMAGPQAAAGVLCWLNSRSQQTWWCDPLQQALCRCCGRGTSWFSTPR